MYYAGWIPTVIGRLSFELIGSGNYPTRCLKKEEKNRFVVVQRRDLLDVTLPFVENSGTSGIFREIFSRTIYGISGRFIFAMIGTVQRDGKICTGRVYLISVARNRQVCKKLRTWCLSPQDFSAWNEYMENQLRNASSYVLNYELDRGGHIKLYADETGDKELNEVLQKQTANQVYFFIKDVSHVHQHHDATHDAITEPTKIEDESDQQKWITQTESTLSRAIIRYKRSRSEQQLFRAPGILAYLKSFQTRYVLQDGEGNSIDIDALEKSLHTKIEELKYYEMKKTSRIQFIFNIFFGVFGFFVSISFIARLGDLGPIIVDEKIEYFTFLVANYPLLIVAFTVLIAILGAVLTHRIEAEKLHKTTRWLIITLQRCNKFWLAVFAFASSALLAWLCYLLLF